MRTPAIIFVFLAAFFLAKMPAKAFKATNEVANVYRSQPHIIKLKNGALLVRLRTSKPKIEALTEKGFYEQAEKVRQQQLKQNMALAAAFRKNFDFTVVYFFYSSDTELLLQGNTTGIFLNEKLERDPTITLQSSNFYIAEIGSPEVGRQLEQQDPAKKKTRQKAAHSGLLILDKNLEQLRQPFPYYIRSYNSLGSLGRDEDRLVELLNEKLWRFYQNTLKQSRN